MSASDILYVSNKPVRPLLVARDAVRVVRGAV